MNRVARLKIEELKQKRVSRKKSEPDFDSWNGRLLNAPRDIQEFFKEQLGDEAYNAHIELERFSASIQAR